MLPNVRDKGVVPGDIDELRASLPIHDLLHLEQRLLEEPGPVHSCHISILLDALRQIIFQGLFSRVNLLVCEVVVHVHALELTGDYVVRVAIQLAEAHLG